MARNVRPRERAFLIRVTTERGTFDAELRHDQRVSLATVEARECVGESGTVRILACLALVDDPLHGPFPTCGLQGDGLALYLDAIVLIPRRDSEIADDLHCALLSAMPLIPQQHIIHLVAIHPSKALEDLNTALEELPPVRIVSMIMRDSQLDVLGKRLSAVALIAVVEDV
jgi:hypothetical protein